MRFNEMTFSESDIERFRSRFVQRTIGECWPWSERDEYGSFYYQGIKIGAHIFAYALHNGSLDIDLHVLHTCDNPSCVNPHHLFQGTQHQNIQDMIAKGRSNYGRRKQINPNSILTPEKVKYAKSLIIMGIRHSVIAKELNVSRSSITYIATGKYWQDVI
jgi:hypothetical protein